MVAFEKNIHPLTLLFAVSVFTYFIFWLYGHYFVPIYVVDDWVMPNKAASFEAGGPSFGQLYAPHNGHRNLTLYAVYWLDVLLGGGGWLSFAFVMLAAVGSALLLSLIAREAGFSAIASTALVFPIAAMAGAAPHLKDTLVWAFGLPTLAVYFFVFLAAYSLLLARRTGRDWPVVLAVAAVLLGSQTLASGLLGGVMLLVLAILIGLSRRQILIFGIGVVCVLAFFYAPFPPMGARPRFGEPPATLYGRIINSGYTFLTALGSPFLALDGFTLPLRFAPVLGAIGLLVVAAASLFYLRDLVRKQGNPATTTLFMLAGFAIVSPLLLVIASPEVNAGWFFSGNRYAMSGLWFWAIGLVALAALVQRHLSPRSAMILLGVGVAGWVVLFSRAALIIGPVLEARAGDLRTAAAAVAVGVRDDAAVMKLWYFNDSTFPQGVERTRDAMVRWNMSVFATSAYRELGRIVAPAATASTACPIRGSLTAWEEKPVMQSARGGRSDLRGWKLSAPVDCAFQTGAAVRILDSANVVVGLGVVRRAPGGAGQPAGSGHVIEAFALSPDTALRVVVLQGAGNQPCVIN